MVQETKKWGNRSKNKICESKNRKGKESVDGERDKERDRGE